MFPSSLVLHSMEFKINFPFKMHIGCLYNRQTPGPGGLKKINTSKGLPVDTAPNITGILTFGQILVE